MRQEPECAVCGHRLANMDEACPICLPGFYTSPYLKTPLRSLDEVLREREAKWTAYCGEIQKAAAEAPVVVRDIADMATTAEEIAARVANVSEALGECHTDGSSLEPIAWSAIQTLRMAQSRIKALIA